MELQDELIKSFTKAINPTGGAKSDEKTVYAEVVRIDNDSDTVFIKMDGSDVETPATSMVKVGVGDRVFATIKDHSVVITGNISYPALTRIGNVYMTMTEDGLVIGQLDGDNNPTGYRILISPSSTTPGIYILDDSKPNSNIVATFGTKVWLGKPGSYSAEFSSEGMIIHAPDGAPIAQYGQNIMLGDESKSYLWITDTSATNVSIDNWAVYRVVATTSGSAVSELSFAADLEGGGGIYVGGGSTGYWGIHFNPIQTELGPSTRKLVIPTALSVLPTIGGTKIAMVGDYVKRVGDSHNISSGTASKVTVTFSPSVPAGYTLGGVTQVYISGDDWALTSYYLTLDNPQKIQVKIHSISGNVITKPDSLSIYYLLIRTS